MNSSTYHQISAVLSQLDMALLMRQEANCFSLPGPMPPWWNEYAGPQANSQTFVIDEDHPFLANFLVDAERFWSEHESGHCASGVWEKSFAKSELLLEAYALRCGEGCLLVIESLRSAQSDQRKFIRAGRNTQLELLRDIARRQQLEIELRDARDAALQLERAKGQLLANTSHELRTPLAGLLGMLELAIEDHDDASGNLQAAFASARGLQRIVGDLLDHAALQAGKPRLELSSFCLRELCEEIQRDFQPAAAEKNLEVGIEIPLQPTAGKASGWEITSDRTRVRQILNNLVDNAIRYTDEGTVKVGLQRDSSGSFQLLVCDTGRGVAADEQRWIFDAFRRGTSSHLHDGGTGLGLAIAAQLVAALGGNIELESAVGQGTTFTVRLPPSSAQAPASHTPAEAGANEKIEIPPALSGLRVLVAEDNAANRRYLVHVLESARITVEEVENGVDLIDRASSRDYDLILTDCRMSGLGGLEAAAKIRQHEQRMDRRVPIIAVTAHTARRHSEPFSSAGVDDILIKPFTRAELFEKIASLVDRKDASSTE